MTLAGSSGVALLVLGTRRGEGGSALEKTVDSSLGPVSSVILAAYLVAVALRLAQGSATVALVFVIA